MLIAVDHNWKFIITKFNDIEACLTKRGKTFWHVTPNKLALSGFCILHYPFFF